MEAFFVPWNTDDKAKSPSGRRHRTDENMREPLREVHNVKLVPKTKKPTRDWFGEKEQDMLKLKVKWLRNQMEMKDANIGALNEELRDSRKAIKNAVQEEVGKAIRQLCMEDSHAVVQELQQSLEEVQSRLESSEERAKMFELRLLDQHNHQELENRDQDSQKQTENTSLGTHRGKELESQLQLLEQDHINVCFQDLENRLKTIEQYRAQGCNQDLEKRLQILEESHFQKCTQDLGMRLNSLSQDSDADRDIEIEKRLSALEQELSKGRSEALEKRMERLEKGHVQCRDETVEKRLQILEDDCAQNRNKETEKRLQILEEDRAQNRDKETEKRLQILEEDRAQNRDKETEKRLQILEDDRAQNRDNETEKRLQILEEHRAQNRDQDTEKRLKILEEDRDQNRDKDTEKRLQILEKDIICIQTPKLDERLEGLDQMLRHRITELEKRFFILEDERVQSQEMETRLKDLELSHHAQDLEKRLQCIEQVQQDSTQELDSRLQILCRNRDIDVEERLRALEQDNDKSMDMQFQIHANDLANRFAKMERTMQKHDRDIGQHQALEKRIQDLEKEDLENSEQRRNHDQAIEIQLQSLKDIRVDELVCSALNNQTQPFELELQRQKQSQEQLHLRLEEQQRVLTRSTKEISEFCDRIHSTIVASQAAIKKTCKSDVIKVLSTLREEMQIHRRQLLESLQSALQDATGSWASDLQKAAGEGARERKRLEAQLQQLEANLKRKIGNTDISPPNKETSTQHWSEVERFNNLFS